jgi:hypothetical protein
MKRRKEDESPFLNYNRHPNQAHQVVVILDLAFHSSSEYTMTIRSRGRPGISDDAGAATVTVGKLAHRVFAHIVNSIEQPPQRIRTMSNLALLLQQRHSKSLSSPSQMLL